MLYAIGELDDFELLKKEIAESHFLVAGVEARVKERLRAHKRSSSPEVSLRPHVLLSSLCVHALHEWFTFRTSTCTRIASCRRV